MSTTLRIAQVESGGGGNGLFVDTITSTTISDTRIRLYTYAVTAASELVIGDSAGPVIKQPVLATNTGDNVYIGDDGVRCNGNVSLAGASNAGKVYIYYG